MGIPTLITTLTAADDASLSFVDGTADVVFDSTYDEYMFVFTDIGPATDSTWFGFNGSTDGGSNYNATKTTTNFYAYHKEDGSSAALQYQTGSDLAQSTSVQQLAHSLGSDADQSSAGVLHLFDPSNTTYVKHFYARTQSAMGDGSGDYSTDTFVAGYINTTSAVDAIQFSMNSGNFDGVIQLYGIS